jgi:4-hydroxy-2-oxoheptanedioate aldolase
VLPLYGGTPEYVQALRDVVVAIMVEKASAVEQLETVLAVPGVDLVQFGPVDYSMSVGRAGGEQSADIRAAERHVIKSCLEVGVRPRAEIDTVDQAKYYADLGVRDFSLSSDMEALYGALKDGGERLRTIIEQETT